jgi:autotransporter-associated beta strand protein
MPAAACLLVCLFLAAAPGLQAQNGVWTNLVNGNASGSWTNALNWSNGVAATNVNNTADFSMLSLTNAGTNTLDAPRTIGNLIYANDTPSAPSTNTNWVVNASSTNATTPATDAITLSVSSGTPVINVSNQITVINAGLFGANGFIKAGAGTLRLNGANSNANSTLGGSIIVTNGDLVAGSTTAFGSGGFAPGGTTVYCTNGGTVEVASAIALNQVQLFLGGTGDGTKGALYANPAITAPNTTRWGLSISNNTSAIAFPAIVLVTNTTIEVDGIASNGPGTNANLPNGLGTNANLLLGFVTCMTPTGPATVVNITNSFFTLTKTGTGNLELSEGLLCSNVVIQQGSIYPTSANHMNGIQQWTVRSGAAILVDQNESFNANTIGLEIDAGGIVDMNFRGSGVAGSDANAYTQSLGTLTGTGTLTCGEMGESSAQTLNFIGTNNNSLFSGAITSTNCLFNLAKTAGTNTTVRLTGTNSYTGTTTVSDGAWLVDGAHTGGSTYTVNSAGILGGSGSISPPILLDGGMLVAGDGGGTLTVNTVASGGGDMTIVSNANLTVTGGLGSSSGYLGTLYLTNATLQLPLLSAGASAFVANLNNDGNVTLVYTSANPAVGDYPLISYQSIGGLAGGGANGFTLVVPSGTSAYLSNNVNNSSLDVVVTAVPALVWNGTVSGGIWQIGGPLNWLSGVTPVSYTDGEFVQFNDNLAGTTNVTLTSTVSPAGITVNNTLSNYTYTGAGTIAGTGGLLKEGAGVLVIANATNTFSGTLSISAGEVRVGNGATAGTLGHGPVVTGGQLTFNRSDNVTVTNVISGTGVLAKSAGGTATLTGITNYAGNINLNNGMLDFAPSGPVVLSNNITGPGALGVSGGSSVILEGTANTWSGGTLISSGTLQIGDVNSQGSLSGSVVDEGILALFYAGLGTSTNNISGAGEVLLPGGAYVTLAGSNSYTGPTVVLGGALMAPAVSYPSNSTLVLGDQSSLAAWSGSVYFTAGNPVLAGLSAGGDDAGPSPDTVNLATSGQVLTINGNVSAGAYPSGATVDLLFQPNGSGSVVINTNGGVIQLGLSQNGSGVNPDNVDVDFSQMSNLVVNLGAAGVINLGTISGNENAGPQGGPATVLDELLLAFASNSITAGTINIGAGGSEAVPQFLLGPGANQINVTALNLGSGGRDGGYLAFNTASGNPSTGGVRVRALDGISPTVMTVGSNTTSATGAVGEATVDFTTGSYADLLLNSLVIGDYPVRVGTWQTSFSFNQGLLIAASTSISAGANNAADASALNIEGGTASLGAVSLTASDASGTLNIIGQSGAYATVTVSNITYTGSGTATLDLDWANFNVSGLSGNPTVAPVTVGSFSASDTVNLGISGTSLTVGQFPLISYTGTIGGSGYSALNLASLPSGVGGYLSNNVNNLSVDVVITNAPPVVNTKPGNILFSLSGSMLNLAWPTNLGWTLQTNSAGLAAANQWFAYPGSTNVTNVSLTLSTNQGGVFFRLVYP